MKGVITQRIDLLIQYVRNRLTQRQFVFLSSILVGITVALAVMVLKLFAHSIYTAAISLNKNLHFSYSYIAFPIVGLLLTVLVVKKILKGVLEKGTSQILYAIAKKSAIIPGQQMYAQIITSSLTVGLGGSAGLESPIVITGAAFGSNFAQACGLKHNERSLLLACGVSAGISAAFNAPIAGVLFATEVLLTDISITAFVPLMIASATGALVSTIILNEDVLLSFSRQQPFDYHNIPYYIILGILAGMVTVYHTRMFQRVENYFHQKKINAYKKAMIGGVLLASLILLFPSLFGEGYESIKTLSLPDPQRILDETLFTGFRDNPYVLLLFVAAALFLKVFATAITLGSGGNGGNFAPSLFVGSYLGFVFSGLVNLMGGRVLPVSNFSIVGMAGILSGLFHAPLTAIFLIVEITGGYNLMVPLMIVSSISFAISKYFEKHSMDRKSMAEKGHVYTEDKDRNILIAIGLEEVMDKKLIKLTTENTLADVMLFFSNTQQSVFPVLDDSNHLLGLILADDLRKRIFNMQDLAFTLVKDIMQKPKDVVTPDETMDTVIKKMEDSGASWLPLIEDGKYIGIVSKQAILEHYRQHLISATIV